MDRFFKNSCQSQPRSTIGDTVNKNIFLFIIRTEIPSISLRTMECKIVANCKIIEPLVKNYDVDHSYHGL